MILLFSNTEFVLDLLST